MEADDDMFVVIVGDGEENEFEGNSEGTLPVPIKEERIDDDELEGLSTVLNIIEQAEKNGHHLPMKIKVEPSDVEEYGDYEYVEEPTQQEVEHTQEVERYIFKVEEEEEQQEEYIYKEDEEDDEEYIYEEEENEGYDSDEYAPETENHRYTMVKPSQRKSFVRELRQQYPELRDEKLLVKSLSEIMRSIKPPPPPPDHFIMNDIMLECVICGAMTESIPAAGRHYQEKHGERYLVCFACGVDFRSKTNLYKHEKRCLAPDADTVLKARALSLGGKGRSRPYLPKPGTIKPRVPLTKKKFPCTQCSAAFDNKKTLMSHEFLHQGIKPYKCYYCPCAYTSQEVLSRHMKKHTGEKFICDHCSRPFNVKSALVTHLNTHLPEKKFKCAECDRRFATKQALGVHVNRDHRNLPPPCACQICPKRYPRMSALKDHMRKAHGMLLVTRTMFLKKLPTLSTTQLQQAKVVTKSELAQYEAENPNNRYVQNSVEEFSNEEALKQLLNL